MRVVTWNVNSIRSRIGLVEEFLDEHQPDVVALQETRCTDSQFPETPFLERGYHLTTHGRGSRNGVALASRTAPIDPRLGFSGTPQPPFDECRLLAATIRGVRVLTVYAPNGAKRKSASWDAKLAWFQMLKHELSFELADHSDVLVIGDFNVCPTPHDLYDPQKRNRNLVSDEERAAVAAILELGLIDIAAHMHRHDAEFTWYSYQQGQFAKDRGYRLDLALATPGLATRALSCSPLRAWRDPKRKPSDHAPLFTEFEGLGV